MYHRGPASQIGLSYRPAVWASIPGPLKRFKNSGSEEGSGKQRDVVYFRAHVQFMSEKLLKEKETELFEDPTLSM
jgi:hypothetical protein